MSLVDACLAKLPELRNLKLTGGNLIKLFKSDETSSIVVTDSAVNKYDEDDITECTELYVVAAETRIEKVELYEDVLLLLLNHDVGERYELIEVSLCSYNVNSRLKLRGGSFQWMLLMPGAHFNTEFFCDHNLPIPPSAADQLFIVVGGTPSHLVVGQQQYEIENRKSKTGFILSYIEPRRKWLPTDPEKFADLLTLLAKPKEDRCKGVYVEDEIKDLQFCEDKVFLLLNSGDFILYTRDEHRSTILKNVSSFSLWKDSVTAVTQDLRVYFAPMNECLGKQPKSLSVETDTIENIFESSQELNRLNLNLKDQNQRLSQLRLFSRMREKTNMFSSEVQVFLEHNRPPVLRTSLRWVEEDTIEDSYFALRIRIQGERWSQGHVQRLKRVQHNQTLACEDILLRDLKPDEFPVRVSGHLFLLEDKFTTDRFNFLVSAPVFDVELSPFQFLHQMNPTLHLAGRGHLDVRAQFFALLDQQQESTTLDLNLNKLENNVCPELTELVRQRDKLSTYTFLGKEVEFGVAAGYSTDTTRITISAGCSSVTKAFGTYLLKYSNI